MSIKSQLSILINLANVDNDFSEDEKDMIYMVGKANGIPEKEIDQLLENPLPMPEELTMTDDDKFEYLFNIVQLMKIDKEVYMSEVKYCEEIAEKLGYNKSVVAELSSKIYSDPSITSNKEYLKDKIKKYQS
jgi:hypothetical protein